MKILKIFMNRKKRLNLEMIQNMKQIFLSVKLNEKDILFSLIKKGVHLLHTIFFCM